MSFSMAKQSGPFCPSTETAQTDSPHFSGSHKINFPYVWPWITGIVLLIYVFIMYILFFKV